MRNRPLSTLLAYDPELRRPGCVIVAQVMDADRDASMRFPARSWLTSPTANMGRFEVTEEQLELLVSDAEARFGS